MFHSRRLPAALKHLQFLQMFYFTPTPSKNVLAAVEILQNTLAVSRLLPNIHEPASLQPITVFPWLT